MKRNLTRILLLVKGGVLASLCLMMLSSCKKDTPDRTPEQIAQEVELDQLSDQMKEVRDLVPTNAVIAHRGSTFWTPEETEAAFRWARNIGADYLEIDIQRTKEVVDKDGNVVEPSVLLALHDDNLKRTTDIEKVFPGRADDAVASFSWSELSKLDAGTWFNDANPENARESFEGQTISTLEDVIMIAKGYRLKRYASDDPNGAFKAGDRVMSIVTDADGSKRWSFEYEIDPADNHNRPGVYVETKEPWLFPNVEADLAKELIRLKWYSPVKEEMEVVTTFPGKVGTANTEARVILQTFSKNSLVQLKKEFSRPIPTCLLLWKGGSDMPDDKPQTYAEWINYGVKHGATIIGPSIAGAPNNYHELLDVWMADMIHRSGMITHAYSFDTKDQMNKYMGKYYVDQEPLTDGMFTNKADMTLDFYKEIGLRKTGAEGSAVEILNGLGY